MRSEKPLWKTGQHFYFVENIARLQEPIINVQWFDC